MPQAILKWGNSLAFRIPAAIAKQLGFKEGAEVEFHIDGKKLVIERVAKGPTFSRQDLVKALRKPQAEPGAGDFGPPRGGEVL